MPKHTTKLAAGRPSEKKATPSMRDDDEEKKVIRLNFVVDESQHEKVRGYCFKNKITFTKLFRDFIDTLPEQP